MDMSFGKKNLATRPTESSGVKLMIVTGPKRRNNKGLMTTQTSPFPEEEKKYRDYDKEANSLCHPQLVQTED